jgi:hypothetical protein
LCAAIACKLGLGGSSESLHPSIKERLLKKIRRHVTYANVMSSLAVFLILGGATAFAAIKKVGANEIKANSIKTGKIVKEAVTAGKIKNLAVTEGKLADGAVTTNKLADNAVTTPKIANDAVTGDKVKESTLGEVPNAANAQKLGGKSLNNVVMWAFVNSGGTVIRSSGGISSTKSGTGFYTVTLPQSVANCAYNATNAANDGVVPAQAQSSVARGSNNNQVFVTTASSTGTAVDDEFMLQVTC